MTKSIRVKQFNRFDKRGNARIHSFAGATSKQLVNYLEVNFHSTTDTVILLIDTNDVSKDI